MLPFDRIAVDLVAPTADARRVFEAVFARDEGLEGAIAKALAAAGCAPAQAPAIDVHYRKRALDGWPAGQHFAVTGRADTVKAPGAPAPPVAAAPAGIAGLPLVTLKVVRGKANRRSLELRAERINIGGRDVSDRKRRLVRRNQLVFVEGEALSESVSRAHAHLRCTDAGECRVRDDNSAYGTRIVRGGQTNRRPADQHAGRAAAAGRRTAPGTRHQVQVGLA